MWEEEVLIPTVNRLKAGESIPELGIEAGFTYDIEVIESNENQNHQAQAIGGGAAEGRADAAQDAGSTTPDS